MKFPESGPIRGALGTLGALDGVSDLKTLDKITSQYIEIRMRSATKGQPKRYHLVTEEKSGGVTYTPSRFGLRSDD
jgi:hypothetical protein